MADDWITRRAEQLRANREKPITTYLPDLGYKPLPNTPCRGAESPTYRALSFCRASDSGVRPAALKRNFWQPCTPPIIRLQRKRVILGWPILIRKVRQRL
jgi:hypothetical protein